MGGKAISPREMEVLLWMTEGKTNWEVSAILGITERTVNFHMANIKKKLDATTKHHAVAIAVERGLFKKRNKTKN